jgi:hypothetical protein
MEMVLSSYVPKWLLLCFSHKNKWFLGHLLIQFFWHIWLLACDFFKISSIGNSFFKNLIPIGKHRKNQSNACCS